MCELSEAVSGMLCSSCIPARCRMLEMQPYKCLQPTGYTHGTMFSKICHLTVKDCSEAKANAALRISIDHTTMFISESDELSDHFCSSISSVDYFDFTFESTPCLIKILNCNKAEQCSSLLFISSALPTSDA